MVPRQGGLGPQPSTNMAPNRTQTGHRRVLLSRTVQHILDGAVLLDERQGGLGADPADVP